jgi:subtilase family serine protease
MDANHRGQQPAQALRRDKGTRACGTLPLSLRFRSCSHGAVMIPRSRLRTSAAVLCVAATLTLAAACSSSVGRPQAGRASETARLASGPGVCGSGTTCYTPQQLQVAYGVKPLLDRGIDGRGETVVLPELAESQLNPPLVTDLRQDMTAFDGRFHLPAARMRVVTTLAGSGSPWLAFGEEVLDTEVVHALAPDAKLVILLLPSTSLDNTHNAVAAAVAELRLGPARGGVM